MDLKEIKELIALMRKNDLSVFKMESNGVKITLKRGSDYQPIIQAQPVVAPVLASPTPQPADAAPGPAPAAVATGNDKLKEITSPMVGTFYGAPSPEAQPYVKVGQDVTEDTVVCIIEAMKVFNEITADCRGKIVAVLVESAQAVEYGQALFRVDPMG